MKTKAQTRATRKYTEAHGYRLCVTFWKGKDDDVIGLLNAAGNKTDLVRQALRDTIRKEQAP